MKLQFGKGKILVQTDLNEKTICLKSVKTAGKLGATHDVFPDDEADVKIEFENLESLRGLADHLNNLAAFWAREEYNK